MNKCCAGVETPFCPTCGADLESLTLRGLRDFVACLCEESERFITTSSDNREDKIRLFRRLSWLKLLDAVIAKE